MKRLEFTCDGCDLVEHIVLTRADKDDLLLDGWIVHHVVVHENGSPTFENTSDLCPECAEKMRHAIDPANWPKMDPTVRRFAKKSSG